MHSVIAHVQFDYQKQQNWRGEWRQQQQQQHRKNDLLEQASLGKSTGEDLHGAMRQEQTNIDSRPLNMATPLEKVEAIEHRHDSFSTNEHFGGTTFKDIIESDADGVCDAEVAAATKTAVAAAAAAEKKLQSLQETTAAALKKIGEKSAADEAEIRVLRQKLGPFLATSDRESVAPLRQTTELSDEL